MADATLIPAFVNPGSGNFEKAREALASSGHFDVREVEPAKLREEIEHAVQAGAKRILVAGGDGSICTGAQAICGKQVELAVLPAGTLNHFAIDSGIPVDLAEAVKVGASTKTMTVDVGYAGERVFLNTSSIGAYVTFVGLRDRLEKRFGYRLASVIAMARIFATMPMIAVKLEVEGTERTYRTPLVFVGVGERELQLPHLGGRVKNGKRGLHVFVVRGRHRARLFVVALAAVARGVETVRRMPEVDAYLVDRLTIETRRPRLLVSFDGETELMKTPLEYRIERDSLRIVVPEKEN
ncbi:MAG TPA: diacylglycerol kinase family protein [Gemmatimonadaceae bacterium]|jgi:diacylglycerol kinase family enzyme|nr:diacylglycerol kinase family protein [Gemmatimonadaceae bacterium]